MTLSARLAFVAALLLLGPGCLGGPVDDAAPTTSSSPAPLACDARVENERVRAREIDVSVDPEEPQRLAAAMMVSIPSTRQSAPDDEPVWTRVLRSADGGQTWRGADLGGYAGSADAATSPFAGSIVIGDPVLAFLPDGTLLLIAIMIRADYSYTMFSARFAGETLQASDVVVLARGAYGDERLAQVPSPGTVLYNDKEEVHVDRARATVYASWMWRHNDPTQGTQSVPVVVMSKDGGKSWTAPRMLFGSLGGGLVTEEANIGQFPFTTSDGQAHIVWLAQRAKSMMISSAPTGTVDFGPARAIATDVRLATQARAIGFPLPSVAVGSSNEGNETAYVVWSDSRSGDADVLIIRSSDGAKTWTAPARIHPEGTATGTDELVPVVAVSPKGVVGVHFVGFTTDRQQYDAFAALSRDGGLSFDQAKVSSKPTRIDAAAGQRGTGIQAHVGDYFGAAFSEETFVAMWQDGRDGSTRTPFSAAYACRWAT